ncbi:Vacuolar-sorting protein SNF7 [Smittium culicis]|uniref:Vacuolar-sorting protein SNF7 n=1 Tax=Smittium culicis TaxID=133412 RepID=A0A1R1YJM9_9FUNG|nr:Vacuolar-sorting protein SNF7 [Smittium culicis]
MAALKRKKMLEEQLDKINGSRMTLDTQMMAIESANVNLETMNAMKQGADAMKNIHKNMNIDKVDQTMDEIREQMDLANEVSTAISQPELLERASGGVGAFGARAAGQAAFERRETASVSDKDTSEAGCSACQVGGGRGGGRRTPGAAREYGHGQLAPYPFNATFAQTNPFYLVFFFSSRPPIASYARTDWPGTIYVPTQPAPSFCSGADIFSQ